MSKQDSRHRTRRSRNETSPERFTRSGTPDRVLRSSASERILRSTPDRVLRSGTPDRLIRSNTPQKSSKRSTRAGTPVKSRGEDRSLITESSENTQETKNLPESNRVRQKYFKREIDSAHIISEQDEDQLQVEEVSVVVSKESHEMKKGGKMIEEILTGSKTDIKDDKVLNEGDVTKKSTDKKKNNEFIENSKIDLKTGINSMNETTVEVKGNEGVYNTVCGKTIQDVEIDVCEEGNEIVQTTQDDAIDEDGVSECVKTAQGDEIKDDITSSQDNDNIRKQESISKVCVNPEEIYKKDLRNIISEEAKESKKVLRMYTEELPPDSVTTLSATSTKSKENCVKSFEEVQEGILSIKKDNTSPSRKGANCLNKTDYQNKEMQNIVNDNFKELKLLNKLDVIKENIDYNQFINSESNKSFNKLKVSVIPSKHDDSNAVGVREFNHEIHHMEQNPVFLELNKFQDTISKTSDKNTENDQDNSENDKDLKCDFSNSHIDKMEQNTMDTKGNLKKCEKQTCVEDASKYNKPLQCDISDASTHKQIVMLSKDFISSKSIEYDKTDKKGADIIGSDLHLSVVNTKDIDVERDDETSENGFDLEGSISEAPIEKLTVSSKDSFDDESGDTTTKNSVGIKGNDFEAPIQIQTVSIKDSFDDKSEGDGITKNSTGLKGSDFAAPMQMQIVKSKDSESEGDGTTKSSDGLKDNDFEAPIQTVSTKDSFDVESEGDGTTKNSIDVESESDGITKSSAGLKDNAFEASIRSVITKDSFDDESEGDGIIKNSTGLKGSNFAAPLQMVIVDSKDSFDNESGHRTTKSSAGHKGNDFEAPVETVRTKDSLVLTKDILSFDIESEGDGTTKSSDGLKGTGFEAPIQTVSTKNSIDVESEGDGITKSSAGLKGNTFEASIQTVIIKDSFDDKSEGGGTTKVNDSIVQKKEVNTKNFIDNEAEVDKTSEYSDSDKIVLQIEDSDSEALIYKQPVSAKDFIDNTAEGDEISDNADIEDSDSKTPIQKKIVGATEFINEAEGGEISESFVDEENDSDSDRSIQKKIVNDQVEGDETSKSSVDVEDSDSDGSIQKKIVSAKDFIDDEAEGDETGESSVDIEGGSDSDGSIEKKILSAKDFIDDEAEGDETGESSVDIEGGSDSDESIEKKILSAKDFIDDEAEEGDETGESSVDIEGGSDSDGSIQKQIVSDKDFINDEACDSSVNIEYKDSKVSNQRKIVSAGDLISYGDKTGKTSSDQRINYLELKRKGDRLKNLQTSVKRENSNTKSTSSNTGKAISEAKDCELLLDGKPLTLSKSSKGKFSDTTPNFSTRDKISNSLKGNKIVKHSEKSKTVKKDSSKICKLKTTFEICVKPKEDNFKEDETDSSEGSYIYIEDPCSEDEGSSFKLMNQPKGNQNFKMKDSLLEKKDFITSAKSKNGWQVDNFEINSTLKRKEIYTIPKSGNHKTILNRVNTVFTLSGPFSVSGKINSKPLTVETSNKINTSCGIFFIEGSTLANKLKPTNGDISNSKLRNIHNRGKILNTDAFSIDDNKKYKLNNLSGSSIYKANESKKNCTTEILNNKGEGTQKVNNEPANQRKRSLENIRSGKRVKFNSECKINSENMAKPDLSLVKHEAESAFVAYIGNLPQINRNSLRNFLHSKNIKGIKKIDLTKCDKRHFAKGNGYGYITFSSEIDLMKGIELGHKQQFQQRPVWMRVSQEYRPEHSSSRNWSYTSLLAYTNQLEHHIRNSTT